MQCPFRIGQKVVCIANGDWAGTIRRYRDKYGYTLNVPVRGVIYTIRDIFWDDDGPADITDLTGCGGVAIRLNEVRNGPLSANGAEPAWAHYEFRALKKKKNRTDISVFTNLLGSKKLEDV
jgi:hypothetical protein